MDGAMADLWLTDPPYNVAYTGKTADALTIDNDSLSDVEFRDFLGKCFVLAFESLKAGAGYYIWHADSEGYNFRGAVFDSGEEVRQCLIWLKNTMVMGRQDYQWKHEPCLYGWKSGASHHWYSDRKQTTILEFDRPSRSAEHPTMKPVKLFSYQMVNSSKSGDIVLDTFLGSGTTLVAAEQLGRTCYGMELSPKYCQVILERYKKYCEDNNKAFECKINGEEYKA
jgi:site-specific DNA-methyltransferase (adenine-specific)